jgi:hypothetical protein
VREWSVGLRWCALLHAGVRGGADDTTAIAAAAASSLGFSAAVAAAITVTFTASVRVARTAPWAIERG